MNRQAVVVFLDMKSQSREFGHGRGNPVGFLDPGVRDSTDAGRPLGECRDGDSTSGFRANPPPFVWVVRY